MNIVLKYAKHYRNDLGYSVIPVGKDKKPLLKSWLEYQTRRATDEELESWWAEEGAQIGIVTGSLSNLSVVDIDSADGERNLLLVAPDILGGPMVRTPRGGKHLYFAYTAGVRNKAGTIPGTDLRGEGGYVVAPPSTGSNGKRYEWDEGLSGTELGGLPEAYVAAVGDSGRVRPPGGEGQVVVAGGMLTEGRRDDDLFHLAHSLIKGGMSTEEATVYVTLAARKCTPPLSALDAAAKVKSAVDRAMRKERNITQEIEGFVKSTEGWFRVTDVYSMLQLVSKEDKGLCRVVLHRLVQAGEIERDGTKDGIYRRIMRELVPIVLSAPRGYPLSLAMPFELEKLVHTYPGNVIVVAGAPNAGKTAFCLDFVEKNQDKHKIHYFNSEMGETELCNRLVLHKDIPIEEWKFNAYERSDHFNDVVVPDEINIIDFLEVSTEFYRVAELISSVHRSLAGHNGIAIICIQKNPPRLGADGKLHDVDMGRGGSFSLEKPRLYLSMDYGRVKIVKAKNWVDAHTNPNGLCKDFKLLGGATFIETSGWYRPEETTRRIFS